jgi:regulation of enolase protein 1 (concanavalin A-like superfamily)
VLQLTLPAGTPHDAWGPGNVNEAVRVMRPSENVDFEIEAKFDAEPTDGYNDQGVLVEQDSDNWLRFDIYHNGSTLKAFMGSITTDSGSTIYLNSAIPAGSATFIRVRRTGDQWTMFHSGDGSSWTDAGGFTLPLIARSVGVYAANPIDALAFTSEVDYVFNTQFPIVPEDDRSGPPAPSDLTATAVGDSQIDLAWMDNSLDEDGFHVERDSGNGFETIDSVDADVNTYSDAELTCAMNYTYRVSAFDCAVVSSASNPASAVTDSCPDVISVDAAPESPTWLSARPNPFKPRTTISFFLPHPDRIDVTVFDAGGRAVRDLVHREFPAGTHRVVWDGRDQRGRATAPGTYFYRMKTSQSSFVGKVILLR